MQLVYFEGFANNTREKEKSVDIIYSYRKKHIVNVFIHISFNLCYRNYIFNNIQKTEKKSLTSKGLSLTYGLS